MRVEVAAMTELGDREIARWSELQRASAAYRSPFFRPEFARAIAELREVRVAVIEHEGAVSGFFPFEAGRRRTGWPLAWPRSNYHGPVIDPAVPIDARWLVQACGLGTWSFDHLPAALTAFAPYAFGRSRSPYLALAGGFERYVESRRTHADVRETMGKRVRRLTRDAGPLRFVAESDERSLLGLLVDWKRSQYAETGVRDVLADTASRALIERMYETRGADFAGALSVLYAGDVVVALQLGLRSRDVWHCWFPAYDRAFHRYSPGLILLLELARFAAGQGIREIDLGKGEARYKLAFGTDAVELLEGCVGARPLAVLPIRARASALRAIRRAGVHRAVRRALHRRPR